MYTEDYGIPIIGEAGGPELLQLPEGSQIFPMKYNRANEQVDRVPIFCKTSKKLLGRVSLIGTWTPELRQWLWCRGCHREHEVTREQIEEARAQDVRAKSTF